MPNVGSGWIPCLMMDPMPNVEVLDLDAFEQDGDQALKEVGTWALREGVGSCRADACTMQHAATGGRAVTESKL